MSDIDVRGIGKPAVGYKHMTGKLYVDCAIMKNSMVNGVGDVGMTAIRRSIRNEFHSLYGDIDFR